MLKSSSSSLIWKFKVPSYHHFLELDLTNLQTSTYLEFITLMISLIFINFLIFWISLRFLHFSLSFKSFSNSLSNSKNKRNSKLKLIKSSQAHLQSKSFKSNHHHQTISSSTCTTTTTTNNQKKHIINQFRTIITIFILKHSNTIKTITTSFILKHFNQIKTWINSYHSKSESESESESIIQSNSSTSTTPTPNLNSNSRKRKQKQKLNPNTTLNLTKNQSTSTSGPTKPILITIGTQTDNQDSLPRSRTISLQTISEFHQDSNQEHFKTLSNRRSKPNLTLDFLNSRSDSHLHQSFQSDQLTQPFQRVPLHSSNPTQSLNHFHHSTRSTKHHHHHHHHHSLSTPPSPLLNKSTLLNHQLELTKSLCWTSPESSSICHQSHTSSTSTRTFSTSTTSSHLDLCQCQLHSSESNDPSNRLAPHHSQSQSSKPTLHSTHGDQTIISPQFESPSHIHLKRLSLGLEVNRNAKDVLNPTITSWNKLCHPSASSSESSRSTHSTNTHPSVINTNEDSLEQDLPPTFSPTIPTHTFHESAPLDVTRFGLGLPISQHLQPTIQDKWASNLTDPIEQSSVTTDDQDHSNLFVTHPQLTHSPAALSSVLPLSPSSSLPPTGSQSSESISYPIQDSTVEPSEQAAGATPSYLFQSSHHSPTHGFHHLHHHPATRSVSNPNRSHSHHSLPLPSLIPPTPPSCTPAHLSHLISPTHPGLSLPPSPLPTPQSSLLYQHPLPSRSSFAGPPPYYYGPNGFHPSLIGSTSSSAYSSGNGYPSTFFTSPSPYQAYPNGSRSTSHGSPNLNPSFYGGMYYTSMSNKKQTQSKRRTSGVGVQANPSSSSFKPPPRMESEGEHEIERLKNRLKGMRAKLREMEIERSRNERELEIARWRLECVGVEKSLEEIETQKAIHHFLERAERAESYLKLLEMKLSNPVSTPSTTSSVTHLVLTNKEEDGEDGGFLRDELELEIEREREREMEREMGMKLEMGLEKRLEIEDEVVEMGMKLIEKNIIMDENEDQKEENENENGEDGNDGNGNQKKWQIVKEFDVDLLEIELDE